MGLLLACDPRTNYRRPTRARGSATSQRMGCHQKTPEKLTIVGLQGIDSGTLMAEGDARQSGRPGFTGFTGSRAQIPPSSLASKL